MPQANNVSYEHDGHHHCILCCIDYQHPSSGERSVASHSQTGGCISFLNPRYANLYRIFTEYQEQDIKNIKLELFFSISQKGWDRYRNWVNVLSNTPIHTQLRPYLKLRLSKNTRQVRLQMQISPRISYPQLALFVSLLRYGALAQCARAIPIHAPFTQNMSVDNRMELLNEMVAAIKAYHSTHAPNNHSLSINLPYINTMTGETLNLALAHLACYPSLASREVSLSSVREDLWLDLFLDTAP